MYILNSTNLKRPKELAREFVYQKTDIDTIRGKTTRDVSAIKEKYTMYWETLTTAEADNILAIINTNSSVTFSVDDGILQISEVYVFPYIASKEYDIVGSNYFVKLTLELIVQEGET